MNNCNETEKIPCTLCGVPKLLEDFPKNKRRKNGRVTQCKTCVNAYSRLYYRNNDAFREDSLKKRRELYYRTVNKNS